MKQILLLLLLFVAGFSNAQKLKYNKDVYPVIESGNYNLAIPLVETFLKQEPDNTNAHYWAAKMYESKLASSDSIPLIQLALNHWIEAKKTVTVGEMLTPKAPKYPDIVGDEPNIRLNQFKTLADTRIAALKTKEAEITQKAKDLAEQKAKEEEQRQKEKLEKERIEAEKKAEEERKKAEQEEKNLVEKAKIEAEYQERMKFGYQFLVDKKYKEAITEYEKALALKPNEKAPISQIAKINEAMKEESDIANVSIKLRNFNDLKISEFIKSAKLSGFESLLPNGNFYTDANGHLLELSFSGYYFYNVINDVEIIQGKFNLIPEAKGQLGTTPGAIANTVALISGELKEGTGFVELTYENQTVLDKTGGLKIQLTYSSGKCSKIRAEQDPALRTNRYFEAMSLDNLSSGNKFLANASWTTFVAEPQAKVTVARVQLTNSNANTVATFNGLKVEKGKTVLNKDLSYVLMYGSDITAAQKAKLVNAKRYKLVLEPYLVKYQLYPELKGYKLMTSTPVK